MCSGGCHCCQSCSLADPVIIPSQGARQRIIHHPGRRDWRAIRFGLVPPSLLCYTVGRKNAVSKKEKHTYTHSTLQSVPPPIQRAQKPSMACLQTHPTSSNTLQTKHTLVVRRGEKKKHTEMAFTKSPLLPSVRSSCRLALFGRMRAGKGAGEPRGN